MNITLRKASALQNSVNDAIKGIDINANVSLNEFQDPEKEISRVAGQLCNNLTRRDDLLVVLYEMRRAVGQANAAVGIDNKLTEVALLEKQIQFYSTLANGKARESHEVISGKLNKIRNDKSERRVYGYHDTVDTTVLTQEDLDGFRRRLGGFKKAKQALQDQILELNVTSEVTLSEQAVSTLQKEGLL